MSVFGYFMRSSALAAIGLIGASCQAVEIIATQSPPTPAQLNAMVFGVQRDFFDPAAVQIAAYTNVGVISRAGKAVKVICLYANSKNRMGAYTGYKWTMFFLEPDDTYAGAEVTISASNICNRLEVIPVQQAGGSVSSH